MNENEILGMYENAGALLQGHFILSSGRHSSRYLQSALVLMHPENATILARELISRIDPGSIDLVVSPAIGGLVIGQEVSRQLNKPFMFTERKEGEMQLRRGFSISPGARVLIVEDVVTTGGSVRECMDVVRAHGGKPVKILALVDRAPEQEGRFDVPFEAAMSLQIETYEPESCPLCREGILTPVKPGSRSNV